MDNEDVILKQMEDTRSSLTEKLETLENKVSSTVDSATTNVAETVEAVKDTVQETVANMKDSVQETITAVKDSVRESVDAVKEAFDIPGQVQKHPWAMMGGSVALGIILGNYLAPKHEATPRQRDKQKSHALRSYGNGKHDTPEPESHSSGVFQQLAPELEKLKGLAIGTLMGTLRDMILPAVPQTFGEHLNGIIDNVTEKLGGTSIKEHGAQHDSFHSHPEQEEENSNVLGSRWAKAN